MQLHASKTQMMQSEKGRIWSRTSGEGDNLVTDSCSEGSWLRAASSVFLEAWVHADSTHVHSCAVLAPFLCLGFLLGNITVKIFFSRVAMETTWACQSNLKQK